MVAPERRALVLVGFGVAVVALGACGSQSSDGNETSGAGAGATGGTSGAGATGATGGTSGAGAAGATGGTSGAGAASATGGTGGSEGGCELDGVSMQDGEARMFYDALEVPRSETCASHGEARACIQGVLSGDDEHVHATCTRKPSMTFAVIGDSRWVRPDAWDGDPAYEFIGRGESVAEIVKAHAPEFVVATGDIYCLAQGDPDVIENTEASKRARIDAQVGKLYSEFMAPYVGSFGTGAADGINRFWNAIGNHEYYRQGAASNLYGWYFPYEQMYYDIVRGDVHFFFLNSNFYPEYETVSERTQEAWLRSEVAASTSEWKIVVMHHPPHLWNPHPKDQRFDERFAIDWQALGIDVVLAGHRHHYERFVDDDGMVYFINGSGGAEGYASSCDASGRLYSSKSCVAIDPENGKGWGAQVVTAGESEIRFDFYDIHGALRDSYTMTEHPQGGTSTRYRDQKRIERLRQIAYTLRLEYANGSAYTQPEDIWCDSSIGATHYPEGLSCADLAASGSAWPAEAGWGSDSDLRDLEMKGYLLHLPVDPINDKTYFFYYEPDGVRYKLCAHRLETTLYNEQMADYRTEPYCIEEENGNPQEF